MVALLVLSAGLASIFNATAPLWGALIAWAWLGERPTPLRGLGLALGFAGVLWLGIDNASLRAGDAGVSPALGIAACIAATACYGWTANYTKQRLTGVPPMAVAAGSQAFAALATLPAALWWWPATLPGPMAWAGAAALALACTGLAYLLYFRLIARVGPAKTITVTFLIPAFAVLWGAMFLGERAHAHDAGRLRGDPAGHRAGLGAAWKACVKAACAQASGGRTEAAVASQRRAGIAADHRDEARRQCRVGRAGGGGRGVHGRQLELLRQQPHQFHARGVEDLGDLRAADRVRRGGGRQLAHRDGAGRVGAQPRLQRVEHTEPAHDVGEVDARRGAHRVREVHAVGGQQCRLQPVGRGHRRVRRAAAHRHAGEHAAQRGAAVGQQVAFGTEAVDHGGREDHHVAGLARQQRFLHRAHRAEAALQRGAGLGLEALLQGLHDTLRGAGTQEVQGSHQSTLMPAAFTTPAHLAMSSFM